jgi:hypothetical protein
MDGCHGCDLVRVDLVIAVVAIQCGVALWLVPWGSMATVKGEIIDGGGLI